MGSNAVTETLTPATIESYLTEYGWTFEPAASATGESTWTTGFQGETRLYPLAIKLSNTCVGFEVRPLIDLTLDRARWPELARDLLELNNRLQLVKLGVAEGGEIVLACQVLVSGFDFETLARILGIIGYYADELTPEIYGRLAAYCPEVAPALLC